jgi:ATP-binding cassette subfamily B protein
MKKIFLKMIQNNRNSFIILTLICGIISFIGSILPYLNGKFIDYLTIGVTYKIILEMSLLILVLGLINVALYYVKQILIAKIKMKSSFSIKMQIIEHLRNISILQFKKYDPSYLNQRTEQDINDIVEIIQQSCLMQYKSLACYLLFIE